MQRLYLQREKTDRKLCSGGVASYLVTTFLVRRSGGQKCVISEGTLKMRMFKDKTCSRKFRDSYVLILLA
jgi:hypothetical protein